MSLSEDRQLRERSVPVLERQVVERAVVLQRVDEGVEPLQQLRAVLADADAEEEALEDVLQLEILAVDALLQVHVAVVAAAHGVDLAGQHRLGDRGVVVEAQDLDARELLGLGGEQAILAGAAGDADLEADEVLRPLDVEALRREHHRGLAGIGDAERDLQARARE